MSCAMRATGQLLLVRTDFDNLRVLTSVMILSHGIADLLKEDSEDQYCNTINSVS